jgi:hypothetical protein
VEVVEHDFFQLLVDFLLFAEDDIPFALDGLGLQLGVLQDVGEDVDGFRDVGVEGFGVVNGVFSLQDTSVRYWMRLGGLSTEVYALRWPPMFSISSSSWCWVRRPVPWQSFSSCFVSASFSS